MKINWISQYKISYGVTSFLENNKGSGAPMLKTSDPLQMLILRRNQE